MYHCLRALPSVLVIVGKRFHRISDLSFHEFHLHHAVQTELADAASLPAHEYEEAVQKFCKIRGETGPRKYVIAQYNQGAYKGEWWVGEGTLARVAAL